MFLLAANKVCLQLLQKEAVTSGSVNVYTVKFDFNSDWDGLAKTAVFQAADDKVSVILDQDNECQIPWEVLQNPRRTLEVGVYGTRGTDLVLPTIWATIGTIKEGASPGDSTQPPTPSVYDQILAEIGDLGSLKTDNKDSLVEAINEIYDTGGGDRLPEITEADEGKYLGVLDGKAKWVIGGSGSGNVSSPEVDVIRVLDKEEYDALPEKDPNTLYFLKG